MRKYVSLILAYMKHISRIPVTYVSQIRVLQMRPIYMSQICVPNPRPKYISHIHLRSLYKGETYLPSHSLYPSYSVPLPYSKAAIRDSDTQWSITINTVQRSIGLHQPDAVGEHARLRRHCTSSTRYTKRLSFASSGRLFWNNFRKKL